MKNYKRIKNTKLETQIQEVLDVHEDFKYVYFKQAYNSASKRRQIENQYNMSFSFKYKDKVYDIKREVYCSCSHTKYRLKIYVNDTKKNVTCLKKLLA